MLDILIKNLIKPIIVITISVAISLTLTKSYLPSNSNQASSEEFGEFLTKNPEIIIDSLNKYYENLEANKDTVRADNLTNSAEELFNSDYDPFIGDKNAQIRIVEFFDYNCGYCRKVYPSILKLNKEYNNIKIIFKEMPILGGVSVNKSKISLAAFKLNPEKYLEAHGIIMNNSNSVSSIDALANLLVSAGYNKEQLIAAANSAEISVAIDKNKELAMKLQISGTPAFIIEDEFIDGAISYDGLKNIVDSKLK